MKHFYLGLSTSTLKLRYFFGLLVLSRGVWTILWEMMSRLKEKYMCVLVYTCIQQKLVWHWAMQIIIIDKQQTFGVKSSGRVIGLEFDRPLHCSLRRHFEIVNFNGKTVSNRLLDNSWSNLYATFILST